MTAELIIIQFLMELSRLRSLVLDLLDEGALSSLVAKVKQGDLPNSSPDSTRVSYRVHGFGCRFEDARGIQIDVDLTNSGDEIFDPWRLQEYMNSLNIPPFEEKDLLAGCRRLVHLGILDERRDGWFGVSRA